METWKGTKAMKRIVLLITILAASFAQAQSPSLDETFNWMSSTLRSSEGNNWFVHHPHTHPYPKNWENDGIDPFHQEIIKEFSHDGCRVKVTVDVIDNDMVFLFGLTVSEMDTDTFDLKDIDPTTIKISNSCEPIETSIGKVEPLNCEDSAGLQVEFKTRDAQSLIHRESVNSSSLNVYGLRKEIKGLDAICKGQPSYSYCPSAMKDNVPGIPEDITSDTLVFHTPEYSQRFAKAFRHAVELCGGKVSAF